jgi:D-aspartate ligase
MPDCVGTVDILQPLPQRALNSWPPVVVASVFQTGLNLIRDLTRLGVRAFGVDCIASHAGFRSRYGKSYVCPDPDRQPAEWVAFMKALARELAGETGGKPVIIPAADIFVTALGAHAAELASDYCFSGDSVAMQAALGTKEQQYALAAHAGFPCPRSEYVQSRAELEAFCRDARFPCLIKPRSQREWEVLPEGNPLRGKKIATAATAVELVERYSHAEIFQPHAVVQEIVTGPDDAKYCYLSVYGKDRSRLGYCVVRQLRTHPMGFGSASMVQPVVDDEIAEMCDRFLRSMGYVGICEIELKRDARDGKVRLIEVNPRWSVTADCASYAGVHMGWLHYLDAIGESVPAMTATRFGFRHIVLYREAPGFGQYLDAGLTTWRKWWGAYLPPVEFFDFDWRDWKVTGSTLYDAARALTGGILRHWKLRA